MRRDPEILTRTRAALGATALAAACTALVGCQSTKDPGAPPGAAAEPKAAEARFVPIGGSTLAGAAVLHPYDGGVTLKVNFNGAAPGRYRVMIHEFGNCSSPNGFSAGPPWAPPGVPLAEEGYPILKNDDSASSVVSLRGYRLTGPDGVLGRSVVVHDGGRGPLTAQPGVRNDRIGCGVIGPPGKGLLGIF